MHIDHRTTLKISVELQNVQKKSIELHRALLTIHFLGHLGLVSRPLVVDWY